MGPIVVLHMANGRSIVIELLPGSAPNTVSSFIHTASRRYLNHHAIERAAPGNWVDVSYTAFGKKECWYLIPNESELNPDVVPLNPHPRVVRMGDYDEAGLTGCEFFFPLRDCPDHRGIYPVFGHALKGAGELCRLEKVETVPVTDFPIEGVKVNRPAEPEITERVELGLHGRTYPESVGVQESEPPEYWK